MAIASDYWKVAADALCDVRVHPHFQDVTEPELCSTTKFLIDFQAVIRRVTSCDAERLSDLDDVISRTSVTKASIELESSDAHEAAVVSGVLRELKVPLSERAHMVERIMNKACDVENENWSGGRKKIVHMLVNIDLVVVDDDDDRDEDGIVVCCLEGSHPYSDRSMVEQLRKTGVCPMCDDDRKVLVTKMDKEGIL